jgi:hypothetical protein
MGGAFTGIADDAFATYYNPAGLAFQENIDMSISQSDWLPGLYPGMNYYYGSLISPVSKVTMGISWTYLNTGTTEVTDENGNYLGEYTSYDMAPAISVGKKISDNFAVGGTFKYVYSFLFPEWIWQYFPDLGSIGGTGRTIAFDIGSLVSFASFGKTGMGIVIQNIGPGIRYTHSGEKDLLPTAIRFGVSHKVLLKDFVKQESNNWFINYMRESSKLIVAYDFYYSLVNGKDFWQSYGMEICFAPLLFRLGHFADPDGLRIGRTVGFGLDLKYVKFDVANDANIYDFSTDNLRYDLSVKLPDKFIWGQK